MKCQDEKLEELIAQNFQHFYTSRVLQRSSQQTSKVFSPSCPNTPICFTLVCLVLPCFIHSSAVLVFRSFCGHSFSLSSCSVPTFVKLLGGQAPRGVNDVHAFMRRWKMVQGRWICKTPLPEVFCGAPKQVHALYWKSPPPFRTLAVVLFGDIYNKRMKLLHLDDSPFYLCLNISAALAKGNGMLKLPFRYTRKLRCPKTWDDVLQNLPNVFHIEVLFEAKSTPRTAKNAVSCVEEFVKDWKSDVKFYKMFPINKYAVAR